MKIWSIRSGGIPAPWSATVTTTPPGTSLPLTITRLPVTEQPLTPPLMMEAGTAQYLQDRFSPIYVGLCNEATLPPQ